MPRTAKKLQKGLWEICVKRKKGFSLPSKIVGGTLIKVDYLGGPAITLRG